MKTKVGITEVEFNKGKEIFLAEKRFECISVPENEEELAEAIVSKQIKHVIIGVAKYREALYKSLTNGSVIARYGVGHDGVDKEAATTLGIFFTNTPGVLDNSVAEYTISLILSAARKIIDLATQCKKGNWQSNVGFELIQKNLAIIGCGPIGKRVAQIAAFGFQMEVTGCEISDVNAVLMKNEYGFSHIIKDFREAVYNADFISIHIPNSPDNYHFLNNKRLAMLPEKAWLINTSRGAIIDENSLYETLINNKIAGAILDVFENEPYIPAGNNDLRTLKNIVMLPHLGSSTKEACDKMAIRCLENINNAEKHDFSKMDLLNRDLLKHIS